MIKRFFSFPIILFVGLAVASCAVGERSSGFYPRKGDNKPHPGVAKAHGFPIHGIDISKWQGSIDWASVREAGTQFAFIKATEGGDHLDERFHENWHAAKAAGIPRSFYHFTYWCRPANEQIDWIKRNVPVDPDALPPVLDVEWNGHSKTCPKRIDIDLARSKIDYMLTELERHFGKRPIIYTDITFHNDVLADRYHDYDFWLRSVAAHPSERYQGRSRWTMWQYTATGTVPGIRGNVDRNAFYGSQEQWIAWYRRAMNRPGS